MRTFLSIMIVLGLVILLVGCRAGLETSRFETRTSIDEIGVELRRVDSLWSSIAERTSYKIEFYPPILDSSYILPLETVPAASGVGNATPKGGIAGGIGAVKSVEISTERSEDRSSITATDSVATQKKRRPRSPAKGGGLGSQAGQRHGLDRVRCRCRGTTSISID